MRLNAQYAKAEPHEFVVVLDHLKPTFNVGKIFRSAQAFGAQAVYMVGMDFFNPYPAQGALRYVPTKQFNEIAECLSFIKEAGYTPIAFDVSEKAQNLFDYKFPQKSALILGHEAFGLSIKEEDRSGADFVKIPMFATIESLNVSVAASIVMWEYVRQNHASAK